MTPLLKLEYVHQGIVKFIWFAKLESAMSAAAGLHRSGLNCQKILDSSGAVVVGVEEMRSRLNDLTGKE